jgi:trans-aconitate methyltransferase
MVLWICLGTSFLILIIVISNEYYGYKTGVPTVASFPPARQAVLRLTDKIIADNKLETFRVIDFGSGPGQLAAAIAERFATADVTGIEISFFPWLISSLRQKFFGPRNLRFQRDDFWSYDASQADIVVLFVTENIIPRMSMKLAQELKAGAFLVVNETPLPKPWQPSQVEQLDFMKMKISVFVYQKK